MTAGPMAGGTAAGAGGLAGIGSSISAGASSVMAGVSSALAAIPVAGWLALGGIGVGFLLKHIFGGPSAFEQAGTELSNVFGQEFSRNLQFHIANQSEELFGGDDLAAIAANTGEIISEALANGIDTGELDSLMERVGDIFSAVEQGKISASVAQRELNESVIAMLPHLDQMGEQGVYQMERILAAAEASGLSFDGMADFATKYAEKATELGISVNDVVLESLGLSEALEAAGVKGTKELEKVAETTAGLSKELQLVGGEAEQSMADKMQMALADAGVGVEGLEFKFESLLEKIKEAANAANFDVPSMPGGGGIPTADAAQRGWHSDVMAPTSIRVAETGPERVDISDIGGGDSGGGAGGDIILQVDSVELVSDSGMGETPRL